MEILKKLDKAGEILNNLPIFKNINTEETINYSTLFNSWESIVGYKIGGYSRIMDLENNSLSIEVDHPAIIQLLQINYKKILFKLNNKYPQLKISDIRMIVKNPTFSSSKFEKKKKMEGDDDNLSDKKKDPDLNNIENDVFRDLLFKMKKRSQL